MRSLDRINEYVEQVCQQIRWEKAHPRIALEITDHITDCRDSYIEQGFDESAATEAAITNTGDAEAIGSQLDRIHRPKPQWGMLIATAILLIIGLLARMLVFNDSGSFGSLYIRLVCTAIGIAGMLGIYFADFTILGKYPKTFYFGVIGLYVLAIAVLFVAPSAFEVKSLLNVIVLLFPVVFSGVVSSSRSKGYFGVVICGLAYLLFGWLVLITITGFLNITACYLTLFGIAIYRNWFGLKRRACILIMLAPPVLLMVTLFFSSAPYLFERLIVAIEPINNSYDSIDIWGLITRELLGSAQFLGGGNIPLDGSHQWGIGIMQDSSFRIPKPHMHFYTILLMTAMIAQMGWVAFVVIMTGVLFFAVKGFMGCLRQKSSLGLFVSVAVMLTFCFQVLGYTVFNLGFQLWHPISLPLVSYGNAELIINLALVGLMLSVFRTGDVVIDKSLPTDSINHG